MSMRGMREWERDKLREISLILCGGVSNSSKERITAGEQMLIENRNSIFEVCVCVDRFCVVTMIYANALNNCALNAMSAYVQNTN